MRCFLLLYLFGTNLALLKKAPFLNQECSPGINWCAINPTGTIFSKDVSYYLSGSVSLVPIGISGPDKYFGIIGGFWCSECEIAFNNQNQKDFPLLSERPLLFKLHQNFPNPFSKSTKIIFDLPAKSKVHLSIYDADGKRVSTIVNNWQDPGQYVLIWDGTDEKGRKCPSGVYFCFIKTEDKSDIKKMVIAK